MPTIEHLQHNEPTLSHGLDGGSTFVQSSVVIAQLHSASYPLRASTCQRIRDAFDVRKEAVAARGRSRREGFSRMCVHGHESLNSEVCKQKKNFSSDRVPCSGSWRATVLTLACDKKVRWGVDRPSTETHSASKNTIKSAHNARSSSHAVTEKTRTRLKQNDLRSGSVRQYQPYIIKR